MQENNRSVVFLFQILLLTLHLQYTTNGDRWRLQPIDKRKTVSPLPLFYLKRYKRKWNMGHRINFCNNPSTGIYEIASHTLISL